MCNMLATFIYISHQKVGSNPVRGRGEQAKATADFGRGAAWLFTCVSVHEAGATVQTGASLK